MPGVERRPSEVGAKTQFEQRPIAPPPLEQYRELYGQLGEGPERLTERLDRAAMQLDWDNLAELFVSQTLSALYPSFDRVGEPAWRKQRRLLSDLDGGAQVDPFEGRPARQEERVRYVSFVKQL